MRKNLKSLSILVVMSIMLAACSWVGRVEESKEDTDDMMVIVGSEFSEDAELILQLVDGEFYFFDYMVDETVHYASIFVWIYDQESGEWVEKGRSVRPVNQMRLNRIGIQIDGSDYVIYHNDDNGRSSVSYDNIADFDKTILQTGSRVVNPTPIELDEEIPLWVRFGTNNNHLSSSSNFREVDCEVGVAVSVVFSDQDNFG